MATTVTAVEARQHLGELLSRVSLAHEEITIERAGKKVAKLVDVHTPRPKRSGKLDFRRARGLGAHLWAEVDAEEYVRQEREQWT